MPSQLTFDATQNFRRNLLIRNLPPYKEGFKTDDKPGTDEFSVNDIGVMDPGNVEVIGDVQERKLYVKNKYGPEQVSGYGDTYDINIDKGTDSNIGEYQYSSSEPSISSSQSQQRALIQNWYAPEDGFNEKINIEDIQRIIENRQTYYTFIASIYNSFNLLTDLDPVGNNGRISQDSNLARIAATQLKTEFEYRIAQETYQQTLGRVNIIDAASDPFDALGILTGNIDIIEKDWHISVPDSLVGKGLDFISRITGVYSPYSWIRGDYFGVDEKKSYLNQAINTLTGLFDKKGTLKLPENKRASDIFLANTGKGQSSMLFNSLEFNKFRPDYKANFINDLNLKAPSGEYYIGSRTQEISDIVSPPNELPVDEDGNKNKIAVRGYSEIGKLYENKESTNNFKFGLNGSKFITGTEVFSNNNYDAKRLQGGFVWLSEEFNSLSKKGATRGGGISGEQSTGIDDGFDSTPKSIDYTFTKGSILDDTQRLVVAAEELQGLARLQHVGNAISQVSKIFHDGTRELTKGSMVYKYKNTETGQIEGTEYCRVFTKDRTYSNNSVLQKSEGMVDSNRKFEYSVLNNTFNLNIAPWKGEESSNITKENAKKYMFSIENLAWRTSNKKGFTYQDLPVCERGPNGGRIMWFPPYDMKVSETNSVNWNGNEFLGRPEPIFTYNNTTRQGNLSWKIVVDHPSIMNAIVDKELKKQSPEMVNEIVDSFMAGCRTYDIYELAYKFPMFTYSDIYDIITTTEEITTLQEWTEEVITKKLVEIPPDIKEYTKKITKQDYSFDFYFHNDVPGPQNANSTTTDESYVSNITNYILMQNTYLENVPDNEDAEINNFFIKEIINTENKAKELAKKIGEAVLEGAKVNITLVGSASSPNSNSYNQSLSKRRIDSVRKYILSFDAGEGKKLSEYGDKITISDSPQGETLSVTTSTGLGPFNCNEDLSPSYRKTYSINAMACRRVKIKTIEEIPPDPPEEFEPEYKEEIIREEVNMTGETTTKKTKQELKRKEEVAKIIVKKLLSECDYFTMMKESTPSVYNGIKEKFKYFHPVFHSMTPEGLNSRLTFLQQCLRPGDTIPVIDSDGKPRTDDAKNTSFGAPPICVLRIGDFYHTKIAIQQMSINYEPLTFDINPEGIGVQPMIADINMSFYFIGGHGIKEPVSRLQNALSFNFYANTEVYDERATITEDRSKINDEVWEKIENETPFSLDDRKEDATNEDGGDTIGKVGEKIIGAVGDGTTESFKGDITYKSIMNELIEKSKTYTENVKNTLLTISKERSTIGMYYFVNDRTFIDGKVTGLFGGSSSPTRLFGMPRNLESLIDTLFTDTINDVDDETSPLLENIDIYNFKNSEIRNYKKNIKNLINIKKQTFGLLYDEVKKDLLKSQEELVKVIDKINFVLNQTDGYKNKAGKTIIYELSGTTEVSPDYGGGNTLDEMSNYINTVGADLENYYKKVFGPGQIGDPSLLNPDIDDLYAGFLRGSYDTPQHTRLCSVFYIDILNDPDKFVSDLLGEELSKIESWVNYVKRRVFADPNSNSDGLVFEYDLLSKGASNKFSRFSGYDEVRKFNNYSPFNTEAEFKMTFEQLTSDNSTYNQNFDDIYSGLNNGEQNKFNLKAKFK